MGSRLAHGHRARAADTDRVTDQPPVAAGVPIAIRVYPVLPPSSRDESSESYPRGERPDALLVWDFETRTDLTQRPTFGCYRFVEQGRCLKEVLFAATDLTAAERAVLTDYVQTESADVDPEGVKRLELIPVADFLRRFHYLAYHGRVLVIAFNAPFDFT